MQPIVDIKTGRLANTATVLFIWALAAVVIFWDPPWVAVIVSIWILFSLIPLAQIIHPRRRLLAVRRDTLVWQAKEENLPVHEDTWPIDSVRTLIFVILPVSGQKLSGKMQQAQLVIITHDGIKHVLPHAVFQRKHLETIKARVQKHIPHVRIEGL